MPNIYYDINGKLIAHPDLMRNKDFGKWFDQALKREREEGKKEGESKMLLDIDRRAKKLEKELSIPDLTKYVSLALYVIPPSEIKLTKEEKKMASKLANKINPNNLK